jgi:hypothetical protein
MRAAAALVLFACGALQAQYVVAKFGPSSRYNDQYYGINGWATTGKAVSGDTWSCAWSDDRNTYCTWNDGQGTVAGNGSGRNVGVYIMSADLKAATIQNSMDDFGTSVCVYNGVAGANSCTNQPGSWTDGYTWKSTGLASVHGVLYLSVQRQYDNPPFNTNNASLLKSYDHGLTWCNYTHSTATGCGGNSSTSGVTGDVLTNGQSIWTTTTMRGPTPVTYCQDNSINCPGVDNNGVYTYLTTNASDFSGYRLLRIPTAQLPDLANFTSNVQYWQGSAGADINDPANWTATVGNAVRIIIGNHIGQSQVYYIAALQRYVFIAWEFQEYSTRLTPGGNYSQRVIYSATSLAGPWTASPIIPGDDQYLAYFALFPSTVSQIGPSQVTATFASVGDYTTQAGGSAYALSPYSLHYEPVSLSLSSVPIAAPKYVGHGRDDLIANGLVQDLRFFPEQSSTAAITDFSGNGNTASGAFQGIYTGQGDASFDGQAYYVNTGTQYTGQNFTTFQVFRKQWTTTSYEQIIGNGGSASCPINVYRHSTDFTHPIDDTWNAVVCQAYTSATQFTLDDGVWEMLAIVRNGTTVSYYDAASFTQTTATPIATATIPATNISGNEPLALGQQLDQLSATNQWFLGQHHRFVFYSRALSTQELIRNVIQIEKDAKTRGIALGRTVFANERMLDSQLPGPVYSTRRVLTSYTGPLLRVHRASDSTEMDIGTAVGTDNLDTTTLQSFCGSSTLTVPVWYDQTYHHWDALQATVSKQPIICSSGTIQTSGTNTKPALKFDGARWMTEANFWYFGISAGSCAVGSISASSPAYAAISGWFVPGASSYNSLSSASAMIRNDTIQGAYATINNVNTWPTDTGPANITYDVSSSICMAADSKNLRQWVDSATATPAQYKAAEAGYDRQRFQFNNFGVGTDGAHPQDLIGTVSELFFFPYAIGDEEAAVIRANQKAYFGTP